MFVLRGSTLGFSDANAMSLGGRNCLINALSNKLETFKRRSSLVRWRPEFRHNVGYKTVDFGDERNLKPNVLIKEAPAFGRGF
jgi:hypothetical protein